MDQLKLGIRWVISWSHLGFTAYLMLCSQLYLELSIYIANVPCCCCDFDFNLTQKEEGSEKARRYSGQKLVWKDASSMSPPQNKATCWVKLGIRRWSGRWLSDGPHLHRATKSILTSPQSSRGLRADGSSHLLGGCAATCVEGLAWPAVAVFVCWHAAGCIP